jgi:hypothetical protein
MYGPSISGITYTIEQNNFQPSLQEDAVFGNYSTDFTFTNYKQCTPEISIDVLDPDGIDSVWFTYRRTNETSVLNQSMDILSSDSLNRYVGYFTVIVSQTTTEFAIQFHTNDSLGHQSSSDEYLLVIRYDPGTSNDGSVDPNLIIGLSIAIALSVGFFILWRKGRIGIDGD